MSQNPYLIVDELEKRISDWCGAPYCVAVESGTAAIFLSLMWRRKEGWHMNNSNSVAIPKYTYPSVACSIIHAGWQVQFWDKKWGGEYELAPLRIWDAALRLKPNMYHGGFQCLSGHIKKKLNIGRAGFILLENKDAYEWLKRARFDGRNPVPLREDNITQLGWNMYLQPSDAARGIQLFEIYKERGDFEDLKVEDQKYSDLSKYEIYKQ